MFPPNALPGPESINTETNIVKCKECDLPFAAIVKQHLRGGKVIKRNEQWCSKGCYRDYFKRVTAK